MVVALLLRPWTSMCEWGEVDGGNDWLTACGREVFFAGVDCLLISGWSLSEPLKVKLCRIQGKTISKSYQNAPKAIVEDWRWSRKEIYINH